ARGVHGSSRRHAACGVAGRRDSIRRRGALARSAPRWPGLSQPRRRAECPSDVRMSGGARGGARGPSMPIVGGKSWCLLGCAFSGDNSYDEPGPSTEAMPPVYEVIIIGSGPAGLTAAIYATRAALKTLVIAGATAGGQLMITTDVENYPGFPTGIQGPELMELWRKQAERFRADFVDDNVSKVDFTKRPLTVWTSEA